MDDFEKRLKEDAAAIDAEPSAALRARIDGSIAPVVRHAPSPRGGYPVWFGLAFAAGIAVLALLLLPRAETPVAEPPAFAATPEFSEQQPLPFRLEVQPVELTEPLNDELSSLRTDFERVRRAIEQDLRSAL